MPTVRRTIAPNHPGTLTEEEKARYDAMPDDEIDYSETPDLGDVDWSHIEVRLGMTRKELDAELRKGLNGPDAPWEGAEKFKATMREKHQS